MKNNEDFISCMFGILDKINSAILVLIDVSRRGIGFLCGLTTLVWLWMMRLSFGRLSPCGITSPIYMKKKWLMEKKLRWRFPGPHMDIRARSFHNFCLSGVPNLKRLWGTKSSKMRIAAGVGNEENPQRPCSANAFRNFRRKIKTPAVAGAVDVRYFRQLTCQMPSADSVKPSVISPSAIICRTWSME